VRSPGWQEGARTGRVWFLLLPPCGPFPSDQPPQLVRDALLPADRPLGELSLFSRAPRLVLVLALVLSTLSACTVLPVGWTGRQAGLASWYGPGFYGRQTASGTVYTGARLTAAHRSLPFGTLVRVTNLENGRRVVVVIDDRGPFIRGRVIDLSVAAAQRLGMVRDGVVPVRIKVVRWEDRSEV
jgi:3D (Asp-Asp-Asp) domain-containing protein